ncbi:hypothetical protein [Mycolicibacterium litorale]|uniref:Uncharacterized protein n=1 Tax=Mycolicibacterium litorale TaxID=758802 RepID=A0AAD1IPG8_9MYCO|nr:hypothetical protein [Mycolicibacterium litorale]MCV7417617.1 hypothetical protein [Mycolicibacterium litorale]TDX99862.1 hypothetical protein BCL50_5315 [Mycolicibacterium litorale]BBY18844.1 hypothetical protein MLIT_44360 [Mycolicibacterium litorale]
MGGMADDPLDQLYAVAPEEFTALRTRLASEAKKRGDTAEAKRISAARKPTVSAAVVNRLVHHEPDVRERLAELGEELRAAHTSMDGERIRELSSRQRKLIEQLTKAALETSEVAAPTAALRDDVTGTLQAAIADPEVTARLGRLAKPEQWSGFGGFGDDEIVFAEPAPKKTPEKKSEKKPPEKKPPEKKPSDAEDRERRRKREQARAVLAAAERAKTEADDTMADRQSDLATARLRHDDARERLAKAEKALAEAEDAYQDAKRASREAGEVVKAAKTALRDGG